MAEGSMNSKSPLQAARANFRSGMLTPAGKLFLGLIAVVVIVAGSFGISMFRSAGSQQPGGTATAAGFGVSGARPKGAADPEIAAAVAVKADADAKLAADRGQSFGGPFVFERGGDAAVQIGPASVPGADTSPQVFAALRKRSSEFDAGDDSAVRTAGSTVSQGSADQVSPGVTGYGVNNDDAKKISSQIDSSRSPIVKFDLLPGGILSRPSVLASGGNSVSGDGVAVVAKTTANTLAAAQDRLVEVVVARAGSVCAATPEASINTDINLPVFVTLLDCGELTGSKVRGVIVKSIDNFTVRFTGLFVDPAKRIKLTGSFDAVAVSIDKDGTPEIADDVDRHWITRLASSALLSLAKTEQQFLSARGSSTTSTGLSSQTSIDPLSTAQQQAARVAGLVSGAFDVVTRDASTGANRQSTMTTKKSSLVGVQFLDDVKVVRFD